MGLRTVVGAVVAAFVVAVGAPAVSAAGRPVPRPFADVGKPATLVTVAGDRYVVGTHGTAREDRTLDVIDTKRRRAWTQRLPAGCVFGSVLIGGLASAADRLLVQCASGTAIMRLSDGQLVAEGLNIDGPGSGWSDIGTVWLSNGNVYRNLGTGEIRTMATPDVRGGRRNLDDPDLAPLAFCAPFDTTTRASDRQQWDGYVVFASHVGSARERAALGRCGEPGAAKELTDDLTVFDRSAEYGYVPWSTPATRRSNCARRVGVYDIARKRTIVWPKLTGRCVNEIFHTKYAVVIAKYVGMDRGGSPVPDAVYRLAIAPRP